jgi:hypothetical protein
MLTAALLALGFGGLPPTGGALARFAVKPALEDGVVGILATLSAIASTLLMFHFLRRLMASAEQEPQVAPSAELVLPWLAIALAYWPLTPYVSA